MGVALRVLALALAADGRLAEANDTFAQSLEMLADVPYEAARTRTAWGRLLAAHEPARAARLLDDARAEFERLGARADLAA